MDRPLPSCCECGRQMSSQRALRRHVQTRHGWFLVSFFKITFSAAPQQTRYECSRCDRNFTRAHDLRRHFQTRHGLFQAIFSKLLRF